MKKSWETAAELSLSTDSTVQYVLFPRKEAGRPSPPGNRRSIRSSRRYALYVSSRTAEEEDLPKSIRVITLSDAKEKLQEPRTATVVAHPYWIMTVASLQPEICIALLPEPVGDEASSPLWESSIARLVGIADLVATSSETRYMKLLFQGIRAVWLGEKTLPLPVTSPMRIHGFHFVTMSYFYACIPTGAGR